MTVANLRPEKGHDTLLAAAPLVAKEHPDVEFVIVGDGVLRESLMRQAQTAGLADRVTFMGERDDVPALLSSSDVFVLPSRSEACPNSVLEAMASALPVVATRIGGIPELVTHGTTGLLVEPNRPEALAAAVLELMSQPERARALGRAARDVAERQFSFARMVSTFERLYLSELTRRATSPEPGRELAAS